MFSESILHILLVVGMFLIWNKANPLAWWILSVLIVLMYFGSKTYHTALEDGSERNVVYFWYNVRSLIFIANIILLLSIYLYYFFFLAFDPQVSV